MKKIILILLCCSMFVTMASCNKTKDIDIGNTNDSVSIMPNTDNDITFENNESISSQLEFYRIFQNSMNSNLYDEWLESELCKGKRSEKEVYADYLALWKDEFQFTIENGANLFDNEDDYICWKNELEQWLVDTQNILKIEMNLMGATIPQLEVIIPYCEIVRQKVIDTKKFLYYYEKEKLGMLGIYNNEILIKWKYDNQ